MAKSPLLLIASALLIATPAAAETDGASEWLSRSFSRPSAKSAPAAWSKPAKSSKASGSSTSWSGGGGGGGESGVASYYWQPQQVASGGTFNPNAMTAAHKTLPFGTRVRVVTSSGRSVDVVINDRGPYVNGRVIDLSRAAAQKVGMTGAGLAKVRLQVL